MRGSTVALWALTLDPFPSSLSTATLGPAARASWQAAALALPRSLPVLWRDVRDVSREPPLAVRLRAHLAAPGVEARELVIDGRSFGLSFLLLLASRVLDLPLPSDIVASVAIDELGHVHGVEDLELKLQGVAALAPGIARVLVAADQRDEAARTARGLEMIGVSSGAQALEVVFGAALGGRLAAAGSDAARRRELIGSFFRLALVGRGASVDWSPVERGAAMALRDWPLETDEAYKLRFAAAVAARHERNAGDLPLPDAAWLGAQPAPLRVAVLTHLVQQSADAGTPPARESEALAMAALPADLDEAFVPHLGLAGAIGRLWAVTGRAAEALDLQRRVARAFVAILDDRSASYQLAEWLRLAGALGDAPAFAEALEFLDRLQTTGGLSDAGVPYVHLARARAAVELGLLEGHLHESLDRLADDVSVPAHVRWSACRWAVRAWRTAGNPGRAARSLGRMRDASARVGHAERYVVLASLDEAIAGGDGHDLRVLLSRLRMLDPGPVGHLLGAHEAPADIVRFYPY